MAAPAISEDYFWQMLGMVILGPMRSGPMAAPPPAAAARRQRQRKQGQQQNSEAEPRASQRDGRRMVLQQLRAVQVDHLLDTPPMSRREANDNTLQDEHNDVPGAQTHLCPSSCHSACQWGWISCEGWGTDSRQRKSESSAAKTRSRKPWGSRFTCSRSRSQKITRVGKKSIIPTITALQWQTHTHPANLAGGGALGSRIFPCLLWWDTPQIWRLCCSMPKQQSMWSCKWWRPDSKTPWAAWMTSLVSLMKVDSVLSTHPVLVLEWRNCPRFECLNHLNLLALTTHSLDALLSRIEPSWISE